MRIDNLKGYFDVREYNAKKTREERNFKGNEATITFDTIFSGSELPEQLAKHAKSYEKDGQLRYVVKFKISAKTKFFGYVNGGVQAIARPENVDLDGARWECCIDYRELNGDPTKQEACGYWVNGIVIKEDDGDMFADLMIKPTEEEPNHNVEQTSSNLLI